MTISTLDEDVILTLDEDVIVREKERRMFRHYPLTTVYMVAIALMIFAIELLKAFVF